MLDPLEILPRQVSEWRPAIAMLDQVARWELGVAIARTWMEGRLEHRLLEQDSSVTALRIALADALDACGEIAEIEWGSPNVDEEIARRWCWIEAWILLSQDEDLFLMDDRLVVPLLEEAAAGCRKREYAIRIVAHHLRDQAHASLRDGWHAATARISGLQRWLPQIRAADHPPLVAYVERLASYIAPQRLDLDEAEARVRDLWRCHEPATLALEPVGREWRAPIGNSPSHSAWIVVDGRTGAMRIDPRIAELGGVTARASIDGLRGA